MKTTELNQGRRGDVDTSSSGLVGPAPELEHKYSEAEAELKVEVEIDPENVDPEPEHRHSVTETEEKAKSEAETKIEHWQAEQVEQVESNHADPELSYIDTVTSFLLSVSMFFFWFSCLSFSFCTLLSFYVLFTLGKVFRNFLSFISRGFGRFERMMVAHI